MDTLAGNVAVITGAGSGIGGAIATSLAARGAHLVVVDIDADRLSAAAEVLGARGVGVLPCHTDISEPMRSTRFWTRRCSGSVTSTSS
jgi:NADP-dependent 3-hydroxy acid dehydrogenase YdfG